MATSEQNTSGELAHSRAIAQEVTSFVHNIDALQASLPALSVMTAALFIACEKSLKAYLEKNCEEMPLDGSTNSKSFKILPDFLA